jgi:carboxymethylenebutenolidase
MSLQNQTWCASDGAEIGIHRSAPAAGGPYPGLIVFPSIFGVTGELVEHAAQIAATGAVVLAFDPFARGDDPGPLEEADRERAFARMGGMDFGRATRDFRELLAALKEDPACNGRVVGLGICLGGPFVFNAAADSELEGVATWHGSRLGAVVDRAAEVRCPVIMDFGDADPVVPAEELAKIESACGAIVDFRMRVHPRAGHGFSHTGWSDHRPDVMVQARADLERLLATLRA